MNEKQQGYLLTGLVALGIALIFLIIRFTEGPVVWLAGTIGFALAGVAAGCFGIAITISVMEKRPWKSGAYNFQYYRLKKRTMKFLKEFAGAEEVIRTKKQRFLTKAEEFGVDLTLADSDFEEMKGLLNR